MLEGLLGGMVDKVKITKEYITDSLQDVAEELGCSFGELLYMIVPTNEKFEFKVYVYRKNEKGTPVFVREITVNEIVGE